MSILTTFTKIFRIEKYAKRVEDGQTTRGTPFEGADALRRNRSSAQKRRHILNAAANLLARSGIQSLSFEAIANEAMLSRQLVRYYYADLEALMCDLCDHQGQAYREALVNGITKIQQPERLNFFLDFFFGLADAEAMPTNLQVYDAMVAYAVGSSTFRERLCAQYQLLGNVVENEIAIAHRDISPAACKELSFLFVSQMHAHWSFVASLGYSTAHNRLARQAFERLIVSYKANSLPTAEGQSVWATGD